ncbi:hypothetical protein DIPPA_20150 [Diplonema papillatum]|nr:hypothetical protein DIPPA_20150 [Diplonema papillatum]
MNRSTYDQRRKFAMVWLNGDDKRENAAEVWMKVEASGVEHWGLVVTKLGLGLRVEAAEQERVAAILEGTPDTTHYYKVRGAPENVNKSQLTKALGKAGWESTPIRPGNDEAGQFWHVKSLTPQTASAFEVDGVKLSLSSSDRPNHTITKSYSAALVASKSAAAASPSATTLSPSKYVTKEDLERALNHQQRSITALEKESSRKMDELRVEIKGDLVAAVESLSANMALTLKGVVEGSHSEMRSMFTDLQTEIRMKKNNTAVTNTDSPRAQIQSAKTGPKRSRDSTSPESETKSLAAAKKGPKLHNNSAK